jgi:hypothetical protein
MTRSAVASACSNAVSVSCFRVKAGVRHAATMQLPCSDYAATVVEARALRHASYHAATMQRLCSYRCGGQGTAACQLPCSYHAPTMQLPLWRPGHCGMPATTQLPCSDYAATVVEARALRHASYHAATMQRLCSCRCGGKGAAACRQCTAEDSPAGGVQVAVLAVGGSAEVGAAAADAAGGTLRGLQHTHRRQKASRHWTKEAQGHSRQSTQAACPHLVGGGAVGLIGGAAAGPGGAEDAP